MSLLGLNFFALSSNYQKYLLDEIYFLIKHAGFSYGDLITMPTFQRKYFVDKLMKEFEKK
jgi:phosphoribosylformylglycinamidine (FGAM) synthase-like amidotransferase family enzyme